jgi:hypothetical protein
MQAELEKWIEENRRTMHESVICEDLRFMGRGQSAIRESDLRALLSRFVLCEKEPVGFVSPDGKMSKTQGALFYKAVHAPASPLGNASLQGNAEAGTMRIVALQGAAEEYARQGNTVLDNELWDKFGKEGGE